MENDLFSSTSSFIEKELGEALNTYRIQHTLVVQLTTAMLIINVSVIGFALERCNPYLIIIGGICQLIVIIIRIKSYQLMIPIIYSAIHLEKIVKQPNIDWLMSTYAAIISPKLYIDFEILSLIPDKKDRIDKLCIVSRKFQNTAINQSNFICFFFFLLQMFIGVFGERVFNL